MDRFTTTNDPYYSLTILFLSIFEMNKSRSILDAKLLMYLPWRPRNMFCFIEKILNPFCDPLFGTFSSIEKRALQHLSCNGASRHTRFQIYLCMRWTKYNCDSSLCNAISFLAFLRLGLLWLTHWCRLVLMPDSYHLTHSPTQLAVVPLETFRFFLVYSIPLLLMMRRWSPAFLKIFVQVSVTSFTVLHH